MLSMPSHFQPLVSGSPKNFPLMLCAWGSLRAGLWLQLFSIKLRSGLPGFLLSCLKKREGDNPILLHMEGRENTTFAQQPTYH